MRWDLMRGFSQKRQTVAVSVDLLDDAQRRLDRAAEAARRVKRCKQARAAEAVTKAKKKEKLRRKNLIAVGWTLEKYNRAFIAQGGLCALCLRRTRLAADHNHETGKARRLLCTPCNTMVVSRADADPSFVKRLADYILLGL